MAPRSDSMTEEEKCKQGFLYDTAFPGREEAHLECAELCRRYNRTRPKNTKKREKLLRKIFGKVGKSPYVEPNLFCGFGKNISVGDYFFANNNSVFVDPGKITFGDFVFIGPNCGFYTAGHPIDPELRNRYLEYALPITVGSNVWIGGGCHFCPGVTIGDNVIIGAGSVVTSDIPSGTVAFGNPCRPVRSITEADKKSRFFTE